MSLLVGITVLRFGLQMSRKAITQGTVHPPGLVVPLGSSTGAITHGAEELLIPTAGIVRILAKDFP